MSVNIEEVTQLSPRIGRKEDFEKIINLLDIKFDYNKKLFNEDIKYRNQTRYQLIRDVINAEDDKDKLIVLYSLRGFFGEYREMQDMRNLIASIKDKNSISEVIKYLDDEKQLNDMAKMMEYLNRSRFIDDEINDKLISEIGKKKQISRDRENTKIKLEKDNEIINKLDDFKNKGYTEMPSWEVAELINELSNDDLKISAMDTYFSEICEILRNNENAVPELLLPNEIIGIAQVIDSMNNDYNKKMMINKYLDGSFNFYKEMFAAQGKDIDESNLSTYNNLKFKCILSLSDKSEILEQLQKEGKLEDYLAYESNFYHNKFAQINLDDIAEEIKKLSTDQEKLDELIKGDFRKVLIGKANEFEGTLGIMNGISSLESVISAFDKDEIKLKAYEEVFKPICAYYKSQYKNNENTENLINKTESDYAFSIISSLENKDLMIDKLIEEEKIEEFLKYGYKPEDKGAIIENNIEKILKYYNINDIESKKDMLLRMKNRNSKVFEQMDYRLLDDKFLNTFSENELNLIISTDRVSVEKLCNYSEEELNFISSIIRNLEKQDDFNQYFEQITENIDSYQELVENLNQNVLSEEQNEKLKNIIQYDNVFQIKTIDDLNNFENIKNQKLQEIINEEVKEPKGEYVKGVTKSNVVEDKKNALLIKMFGVDYKTARNLVSEFAEQTNEDKQLKLMKRIVSLDDTYPKAHETDKFLKEIYNDERIQKEKSLVSKIDIRKKYVSKYEKMYNDVLFKPEEGTFIGEKDGIKIYDAGDDFSILSTSVAAYDGVSDRINNQINEKEAWLRKDLSSNHFCGTFSRDDMIGMILTNAGVYYGFSNMREGSLLFMSAEDNQSASSSISSNTNARRPFRNPDSMVEHTGGDEYLRRDLYNEFDVKRELEGIKQEPDYIIAIKVEGKVINEEAAIKTANDWKKEKPIVILDIDRCIEKGIENTNQSIKEYELNPSNENLKNVWDNFHKASITYGNFYKLRDKFKQHEDFLNKFNLPNELKDNIDNDSTKTYYYYLKNKEMFEKDERLNQEENMSEIREMLDDIYGEKAERGLTFNEIGKATLGTYTNNPEKAQEIENEIEHEIENGNRDIQNYNEAR